MNYLFLALLFVFCFPYDREMNIPKKRSYIQIPTHSKFYSKETQQLIKSAITGNKKQLSRKLKNIFSDYGLLHLLTPSGLHLSSLLIIRTSSTFFILLYILIFWYLAQHATYNSMERVLIFKIITLVSKRYLKMSLEIIFIITFWISLLIGHYQNSALSFLFSLYFWGTILIFRHSKISTIIYLNIGLYLVASLTDSYVMPSSLIINPILTFIFSSYFPILLIGTLSQASFLLKLNNLFISNFIALLQIISQSDPLPKVSVSLPIILIFILLFQSKRFKLAVLILCLNTNSLNINSKRINQSQSLINLGPKEELIRRKNNSYIFIDQACLMEETYIFCKKKPSNFGGPAF